MFRDCDDLIRQMEFEMRRCSAEAMRRLVEIPPGVHEFWFPHMDLYETEDELVARVELAGVRKESLSVTLSADKQTLKISGNRADGHIDGRKKIRYHQLEVYFGPFERNIQLPDNVPVDAEKLTATYRDGFLVVTMPKSLEDNSAKTILIEELDDEYTEST